MVQVYLTEVEIDGEKYAERICARSWEEAETAARARGATLLGMAYAQIPAVTGQQVFEFIANVIGTPFCWNAAQAEQLEAFLCNPQPIKPDKP
jgi:hypothetical protein